MSDYIKREDAIKEANAWSMFGNDNLGSRLKGLPSADVVEVVRCKGCKFWNKDENVLNNRGICDEWSDYENGINRYTGRDDYCSCGKGKEQEHEL